MPAVRPRLCYHAKKKYIHTDIDVRKYSTKTRESPKQVCTRPKPCAHAYHNLQRRNREIGIVSRHIYCSTVWCIASQITPHVRDARQHSSVPGTQSVVVNRITIPGVFVVQSRKKDAQHRMICSTGWCIANRPVRFRVPPDPKRPDP